MTVVLDIQGSHSTLRQKLSPKSFPFSCTNLPKLHYQRQIMNNLFAYKSCSWDLLTKYANHSHILKSPGTGVELRNQPWIIRAFDIDKSDNCIYIARISHDSTYLSQSYYQYSKHENGMELKETDFNFFPSVSSILTTLKVYYPHNQMNQNHKSIILTTYLREAPLLFFPDGTSWQAKPLQGDIWCGSIDINTNKLLYGSSNILYQQEIGISRQTTHKLDTNSSLFALNWSTFVLYF